jgi:hypothetical protein
MKIAIYNGCHYHFELYGYIIHYCNVHNYSLTIYDVREKDTNLYFELFQTIFTHIAYKDISEFNNDKLSYDFIFLTTDDDYMFDCNDTSIHDRIICIDHAIDIRRPCFKNHIACRPFPAPYFRDSAVPIFPITPHKQLIYDPLVNDIHITIIGDTWHTYDTAVINRLVFPGNPNKIHIHSIGRITEKSKFPNLDESKFILHLHRNIDTIEMISIMDQTHYLLIGIHATKDYVNYVMNGAVIFSFSTLTPILLQKEMNQYYQFKNGIEFAVNCDTPIELLPFTESSIMAERDNIIEKNNALFESYLKPAKVDTW